MVTPFHMDGSIDFASLENLVNNTIRNGVDFLVALGTTAETPVLSTNEKRQVLEAVLHYCDERIPVVAGIGGNNTAEVIEQLNDFDLRKVIAILSVAPYYNKPTQEGMFRHFHAIAEATKKNIILYNVPGRTGSNLLPATVVRLAQECSNIMGIKEASGNMVQCMELIQLLPPGFKVFSGDDNLALAHIAIGMEGVISVAANCFAKDFTEMVNLAIINKTDKARKIHYKLLTGIDLLFAEGNPAGVKAVLSMQGICQNAFRLPIVPVSDGTATKIAEFLQTIQGPGINI